jgi:hypothetical protein
VVGIVDHPGREPEHFALQCRQDFEAHRCPLPQLIIAGIVAPDRDLINLRAVDSEQCG